MSSSVLSAIDVVGSMPVLLAFVIGRQLLIAASVGIALGSKDDARRSVAIRVLHALLMRRPQA
ncbi:hypothetical protein [Rhodococcus sp. UNC23MFCrub1.1]|uniref:hypothetical protein n=1 Tax=Rhodococcus sp. UNC23MFCrub1.1 TaxID=1449068 RepID=UPI0012DCDE11|nr:hypothetical protein [Rhodococcus sp. UNC23MFCrub1.1]